MKKSPGNLPDFVRPPLSEVVLSIQFASLTELKGIQLGLFWKGLRKSYPHVSEQPPIQTVFETFGAPQTMQTLQLQAFMTPPMPRYWFERKGEPHLLQIQHDRLVHNWRGGTEQSAYPRYEKVKAKLEKEIFLFSDWLASEGLGTIQPNQCEVTYTNLIDFTESDRLHADLDRLTPMITKGITENMPAELEDTTTNSRFVFFHNERRAGRIYVQFQPVFRQADLAPLIKLEITARGRPEGEKISDALDFLDVEHEQVVKTFAAVTTEEMHKLWGRRDGKR